MESTVLDLRENARGRFHVGVGGRAADGGDRRGLVPSGTDHRQGRTERPGAAAHDGLADQAAGAAAGAGRPAAGPRHHRAHRRALLQRPGMTPPPTTPSRLI